MLKSMTHTSLEGSGNTVQEEVERPEESGGKECCAVKPFALDSTLLLH